MISIPWTIYHQNLHTQWDNQWEFVMYDGDETNTKFNTYEARIMSYLNDVNFNHIVTDPDFGIAIPQTRIKKISFPLPFPEFKVKELPNKMNVYDQAEFNSRDVSVTITEDTKFNAYKYFKQWFDLIYDIKRQQFNTKAETIYKYGCVIFKKKGLSVSTDLSSTGITPTADLGLIDKPSMRFNLHRLKLIGINKNFDLDYENGKPLELTINMKVENVTTSDE